MASLHIRSSVLHYLSYSHCCHNSNPAPYQQDYEPDENPSNILNPPWPDGWRRIIQSPKQNVGSDSDQSKHNYYDADYVGCPVTDFEGLSLKRLPICYFSLVDSGDLLVFHVHSAVSAPEPFRFSEFDFVLALFAEIFCLFIWHSFSSPCNIVPYWAMSQRLSYQ